MTPHPLHFPILLRALLVGFFFFLKILFVCFLIGTIFKAFVEFVTLHLFYVLDFWPKGMSSSPTKDRTCTHWKAKPQPLDLQRNPLFVGFGVWQIHRVPTGHGFPTGPLPRGALHLPQLVLWCCPPPPPPTCCHPGTTISRPT